MNREIAALLVSIVVNDASVDEALRHRETFWYDQENMPAVYQREGLVFHKIHNAAQNANNESPWNRPAGTDQLEGVRSLKFLRLHKGKRIVYWAVNKKDKAGVADEHVTVVWAFPPGTIVGELLIDEKLGLYEIRTRTRLQHDWETKFFRSNRDLNGKRLFEVDNLDGIKPIGHADIQRSCLECHRDTGVDQSFLPGAARSQWIGKIRGSDGIFSWHPFVAPDAGFSREPIINERLENMIRPRREGETFDFAVEWLTY